MFAAIPMRRVVLTPLWMLLALAVAYGAWKWVVAASPRPPARPPAALRPVPVRTLELAPRAVALEVAGYGTLLPGRRARLAAEVAGRLAEVHEPWRVGELVPAGALVFAVDDEELELELARLEASLEVARAAVQRAELDARRARESLGFGQERLAVTRREDERQRQLLAQGHTSASARDRALAELAAAEEAVSAARAAEDRASIDLAGAEARVVELTCSIELARARLARARVHAPFAGRIAARPLALGTTLTPGSPVVELVDTSALQLSVPVPEGEMQGVRKGLSARVTLPSRPGFEVRARVAAIAPEADPVTRSVAVELDVPDHASATAGDGGGGEPLLAGQFAEARIEVRTLPAALVVERALIGHARGRPVVFVVAQGPDGLLARAVEVELGRDTQHGVLVLSGLEPGALLVTAPLALVSDGAPVVLDPSTVPAPPVDPEPDASR